MRECNSILRFQRNLGICTWTKSYLLPQLPPTFPATHPPTPVGHLGGMLRCQPRRRNGSAERSLGLSAPWAGRLEENWAQARMGKGRSQEHFLGSVSPPSSPSPYTPRPGEPQSASLLGTWPPFGKVQTAHVARGIRAPVLALALPFPTCSIIIDTNLCSPRPSRLIISALQERRS